MIIKPENCAQYESNPLVEVVAQFRFPPILAVANEGPALIQEQLAYAGFPNLRKEESASISVTFSANGGQAINANQVANPGCVYHFDNADVTRTFSICSDFVAFSTSSYIGWKSFQEDFIKLVAIFAGAYKPIMVGRIGLRYKDLIEREPLGLAGVPWSELLNPIVSGFFSTMDFVEEVDELSVEQQMSQTLIQLSDCKLLLQSALLRSMENNNQQAFLIDSDFFVESNTAVSVQDGLEYLNKLHVNANSVFRKCIKEPLHAALRPL